MSKIYRIEDRLKVKVHDLIFSLKPLSYEEKCEIQELLITGKFSNGSRAAMLAIRYSLKDVKGLKTLDNEDYHLEFSEDGNLSDKTLDELSNIDQNGALITVCLALVEGIPTGFIDPHTGKKMKGVEIVREKEPGKK